MPRIGLDLDNTLIDYDGVFGPVGVELGMLPPNHRDASKSDVRDYLRRGTGGEADWMRLQGQVYGRYISQARLFDGVPGFIGRLRDAGATFTIISHKTRHGHFDLDRIDLWEAARRWLDERGVFDPARLGFAQDEVIFDETREGKLKRIAEQGCVLFVDDLPEVLRHPAFPAGTRPLWFARTASPEEGGGLTPYRDWQALTDAALAAIT